MKYKILKDCKYSPNGYDVKELKVGDVVELPDSIGVPFAAKGICEKERQAALTLTGIVNEDKDVVPFDPTKETVEEAIKKKAPVAGKDQNPTKKDAKKKKK